MRKNMMLSLLIFLTLLLVNFLFKPIYINYSNAIKDVLILDDSINIVFNDDITNYTIEKDYDNNYRVYAYKQRLNINKNNILNLNKLDSNSIVYYSSFDGTLDKVLFGNSEENFITLSRLTLNYYNFLSIIIILFLIILFVIIKKERDILLKLIIIPISYLLADFITKGFNTKVINISYNLLFNILFSFSLMYIFYSTLSYIKSLNYNK